MWNLNHWYRLTCRVREPAPYYARAGPEHYSRVLGVVNQWVMWISYQSERDDSHGMGIPNVL